MKFLIDMNEDETLNSLRDQQTELFKKYQDQFEFLKNRMLKMKEDADKDAYDLWEKVIYRLKELDLLDKSYTQEDEENHLHVNDQKQIFLQPNSSVEGLTRMLKLFIEEMGK